MLEKQQQQLVNLSFSFLLVETTTTSEREPCYYDINFSSLLLNPLYSYTGPCVNANAWHQQEEDRGSGGLVRFVGDGKGASGHPQR